MLLENCLSPTRGILYGEYRSLNDARTDCRPVIALSHRLKRKKEILIYERCYLLAFELSKHDQRTRLDRYLSNIRPMVINS